MIPSVDEVVGSHAYVARRYGLTDTLHEAGIRNALTLATGLAAGDQAAEPAALFYALACFPRSLGACWWVLPTVLAVNHARTLGYRFGASREDLQRLYEPIAANTLDFEDVRAWFARRLHTVSTKA
jgi:hypothetical protein